MKIKSIQPHKARSLSPEAAIILWSSEAEPPEPFLLLQIGNEAPSFLRYKNLHEEIFIKDPQQAIANLYADRLCVSRKTTLQHQKSIKRINVGKF